MAMRQSFLEFRGDALGGGEGVFDLPGDGEFHSELATLTRQQLGLMKRYGCAFSRHDGLRFSPGVFHLL